MLSKEVLQEAALSARKDRHITELLHAINRRAVQRGRGLVLLCRMLSRLRRGFNVGTNVGWSAGRHLDVLFVQQLTAL